MIDNRSDFTLLILAGFPILLIINLILKRRLFAHVISLLGLVYGAIVISVTLFPVQIDPKLIAAYNHHQVINYNLVPFKSITGSLHHSYYMVGIRNVLGNLLLLFPFGIIMGVLKTKTARGALLSGLLVSRF